MESVFLPGRGLPSSVRRVSERASVSLANPLTRKEGERLAKQRRAERAQLRPREHSDVLSPFSPGDSLDNNFVPPSSLPASLFGVNARPLLIFIGLL